MLSGISRCDPPHTILAISRFAQLFRRSPCGHAGAAGADRCARYCERLCYDARSCGCPSGRCV